MKGIELARLYFEACGKPMLEENFASLLPQLAVGLCGSGSECYGYDDAVSADHDFEPGFCIFVPEGIDRKTEFQLERAYAKLPKSFMGYQRNALQPVGGSRHGVLHTAAFFTDKTGTPDGRLSLADWFALPEFALLEATNGEIFTDRLGEVSAIRARLRAMPRDVRLKKLAAQLLNMGQAGQYNYSRCIRHGENGGAALAAAEFVKSALQTIFLLNRRYMPYYKWAFRALRDLPLLCGLAMPLEFLISADNEPKNAQLKAEIIEDIAAAVLEILKQEGLTKSSGCNLEAHAYAVNACVEDPTLRNEHILFAL